MKWSELPKEYRDLIDGLSEEEKDDAMYCGSDNIILRLRTHLTQEDSSFWLQCHKAKTISELPKIPLTIK